MFESVFAFTRVFRHPHATVRTLAGLVTMNGHPVGTFASPKGARIAITLAPHVLTEFKREAAEHGKCLQHWATLLLIQAVGTAQEVQTCYDMKD
jgi:hypothetical protein